MAEQNSALPFFGEFRIVKNKHNEDVVAGSIDVDQIERFIVQVRALGKNKINFRSGLFKEPKTWASRKVRATGWIAYDDWMDKPKDNNSGGYQQNNYSQQYGSGYNKTMQDAQKSYIPKGNIDCSSNESTGDDIPF